MVEYVDGQDERGSARRVARNAAVRGLGEIIGKFATFAMFVAIARKLGPGGFGDITFALALTGQLLSVFGFGLDMVLVREVARQPRSLGAFMGSGLVLKSLAVFPALLITAAVVEFGGYSSDARLATYLIGLSVAIDTIENAWNAAFQAFERQEFTSAIIVFQRLVTGGLVLVVLAAGAGVIAVSGIFLVTSVATILVAMRLLRFVTAPAWSFRRSRLMPLVRMSVPVGLATLLLTVLLRLDTVLLSLLTNNHEVGIYGSAFRLFESTMFLSWSLHAAIFPWLSRKNIENRTQLARGYEIGLLVMVALLTPIGVAFALLAEPIINLIYGEAFDAAVSPLRLLGVVVVAFGVNTLTNATLAAHDRPGLMHRILLVAVVQNVAMNFALIPFYGPLGAALSAAASGALLALLSVRQATTALGHARPVRMFTAPAVGAAVMALVIFLVHGSLLSGLIFGGTAYVAGLLVVERLLFPDDFAMLVGLARIRTPTP